MAGEGVPVGDGFVQYHINSVFISAPSKLHSLEN